ncbi:MAG: endonuclease III [candidate division WOR-3 bacterium]
MPRRQPYRVLVAAVLSTRTQDPVTAAASRRLFRLAPNPAALARMQPELVRKLIYPVGFYRRKSRVLPALGRLLVDRWHGRVPRTLPELVSLPGVGRKVANIVISQAFGRPAIAVDIHVQRISNRLGLVRTQRSDQTELALMQLLPRSLWADWNRLLVALGQTTCRPVRPLCPACPVRRWCARRGVRL